MVISNRIAARMRSPARRRGAAIGLAVHGHLEQDRREDAVAVEARAGDDPAPHLVDEVEPLLAAGLLALLDPVQLQPLRGAPTALVERCEESGAVRDLVPLGLPQV